MDKERLQVVVQVCSVRGDKNFVLMVMKLQRTGDVKVAIFGCSGAVNVLKDFK